MRPVLGDMRKLNHSRIRHFASSKSSLVTGLTLTVDKLHTEVSKLSVTRSGPKATASVSPESYNSLPTSGKLIELELESPTSGSDFTETDTEDESPYWKRK
jgi:hypothetical protein